MRRSLTHRQMKLRFEEQRGLRSNTFGKAPNSLHHHHFFHWLNFHSNFKAIWLHTSTHTHTEQRKLFRLNHHHGNSPHKLFYFYTPSPQLALPIWYYEDERKKILTISASISPLKNIWKQSRKHWPCLPNTFELYKPSTNSHYFKCCKLVIIKGTQFPRNNLVFQINMSPKKNCLCCWFS